MWPMGAAGADALLFRSADRGSNFAPMVWDDGVAHPMRGMPMRLRGNPVDGNEFFGVLSDGSAIRVDQRSGVIRRVADRLPPAYDFAIIP
jgi:hypothetical protein